MQNNESYEENDTLEYNDNKYLYSWGFGKYGQIGGKFLNYSLCPIKQSIDEREEIFLISAGESHSAILTLTPKLYMYGKNHFGQLGLANNHYIYNPTKLEFSEKIKISKVSCGGDHTLALSDDNNLYSWGLNAFGQLGLGDFLARNLPVKVEIYSSGNNTTKQTVLSKSELITEIAAGAQHSMILTCKSTILTCGYSKFCSLGYETDEDVNLLRPVESLQYKNSIVKIACGVYHSGCIADNETLYIWGVGEILKFTTPTAMSLSSFNATPDFNLSPNKKINPSNVIRDIKIAEDSVFLLTKSEEVYAMGDNKYGQLGNKSTISRNYLQKIELTKIKQLEVGFNFVMVVASDNTIYGWGNNEYGQLGLTTGNSILKPTLLPELSKMGVFKLACGGYHSLGLFNNTYEDLLLNNGINANNQNEVSKIISEIKKNLLSCNLNSTIKKDYSNISEKVKFLENMKIKISDLEKNLISRDVFLKDLIVKDEELTKRHEEAGVNKKPNNLEQSNPRGFDNNFEISLDEIDEFLDIGHGTFGDVRKGVWRKEHVAIKFLKSEMTNSEDNINAFIDECNMLKNLRHPNILLFMGASTTPPYYFIVTEFCENGNLFELLHQHKNISLNWEDKRRIALEIALGMNYLHSFNPPILHRDLKSMNLLLDKNFQIKIADFGSTKFLEVQMTKQKGTFQWMAPEVIKGNSYTEKADVFSFGIIMNELASRQPPYYGVDKKEVAKNVANKPDYRPAISRSFPKEWAELMIKCWEHNPNKRPSYSEIVDSLTRMKLTR
jgi:mitogen-activated protein kinase kinase kinase 9